MFYQRSAGWFCSVPGIEVAVADGRSEEGKEIVSGSLQIPQVRRKRHPRTFFCLEPWAWLAFILTEPKRLLRVDTLYLINSDSDPLL